MPRAAAAMRRLRLAQPCPAGDRERRHRHRPDARRPPVGAERRDQGCGLGPGAGVVPEDRRAVAAAPAPSRTTRPCCCAPMLMAAMSRATPVMARASRSAVHQPFGSLSRAPPVPVTSCGARPRATCTPVSASITTTVVDWVELSTPATSLPCVHRHPQSSAQGSSMNVAGALVEPGAPEAAGSVVPPAAPSAAAPPAASIRARRSVTSARSYGRTHDLEV